MRVIIFSDDHEPAHVHVFGDGQAKVNLIEREGGSNSCLGSRYEKE